MNTYADKTQENKSQSVSAASSQRQSGSKSSFQFVDNRSEVIAQRKLQEMANNSPKEKQAVQLQAMANNHSVQQAQLIQKKENNTGLTDNLKTGIENLSGYSMDDVKVHRNSAKPAQLNAHAYAHGEEIHLGSGQEKHLPHEAWHVVQQKQGRVKPTMQMKRGIAINDDAGLEKEADVMGAKALTMSPNPIQKFSSFGTSSLYSMLPIQRVIADPISGLTKNDTGKSNDPAHAGYPLVTQRMISNTMNGDFFANTLSASEVHKKLIKYLYFTKINSRGQTFEEAVTEFTRLKADSKSSKNVEEIWTDVKSNVNEVVAYNHRTESTIDKVAQVMSEKIKKISDIINEYERAVPSHPNKQGITPDKEFSATVPQSELSIKAANDARQALKQAIASIRKVSVITYRHYDNKARRYYYNKWMNNRSNNMTLDQAKQLYESKYRYKVFWLNSSYYNNYYSKSIPYQTKSLEYYGNHNSYRWKEKFMLGALVMPSGKVMISHSGFMPDDQFDNMFKPIIENLGYQATNHGYNALTEEYEDQLKNMSLGHDHSLDDSDKSKVKSATTGEKGNPPGVCAAPQVIGDATHNHIPDKELQPSVGKNNSLMSITEVYVSANDSQVSVKDSQGQDRQYGGHQDVASCLTCQFQLKNTLKTLKERVRKMDEMQSIKADVHFIGTELKDLKKQLVKVKMTQESGETIYSLEVEVKELSTLIEELSKAIDNIGSDELVEQMKKLADKRSSHDYFDDTDKLEVNKETAKSEQELKSKIIQKQYLDRVKYILAEVEATDKKMMKMIEFTELFKKS